MVAPPANITPCTAGGFFSPFAGSDAALKLHKKALNAKNRNILEADIYPPDNYSRSEA
ncbi:hypothetical protein MNKW57_22780 [Biformimicrobium ophioploci]|uniref:Uncharacterized protein n=1 Tax=Biformimicrobium ophioploci TaxID=3036711 RepID=A0ABQ6M0X3_9GAMM|nr:hypothetical protein MNKW57_22780 [Microbulbifer sp. NKW57]